MDIRGLREKGSIKAWLPVVEGEVKVLCSHVDQSEWEDLRAQCTTSTLDPVTGKTAETFDLPKFRQTIGRRVVQDIDGITDGADAEDKPVPMAVTPENIDLLMEKWGKFRFVVMSAPMDLTRMLKAQLEEEKKNS